jgi:hypothetical protein
VISRLLTDFQFQKRRLYDVTSVLSAMGCCERRSNDYLHWFGLSQIPIVFRRLQLDANANCPEANLDSIIGGLEAVAIAPLTVQVVMCFLALHLETIDIRQVSRYLSRATRRHKSTLCKVYQIAHILEAAEIIRRSGSPGQVSIAPQYFVPVAIGFPAPAITPANPYSIEALLKHPDVNVEHVVQSRRADFFAEVARDAPAIADFNAHRRIQGDRE